MSIVSHIDEDNDLTIFNADGNPTFDEFMDSVRVFYENKPTKNVLWNLTQAAIWDLSGEHIEKIAYFAPRFDKERSSAKTALVASDNLSQALSRLFILFGESKKLPVRVKLFQTAGQALEWIKETV